ncbi:BTAD domain-containing putative transcriptional regulator [Nonomuraea longicatena]|uniref:BTAD domain-containing putative transcriptional regulator n=1 Tax=Nonomuraea longicatena TaxID=83682 RepID=A0ABN1P1T2_9ACTN
MRFGVLGPLAVWASDGAPSPVPEAKVRLLLAVLLADRGQVVSSSRLVDALWEDRPPRDPVAALRVKVSQLRTALGSRDVVRHQPPGYLLDVPADAVDADRFLALVAPGDAGPRERAGALAEALGLWRGPAYSGFEDLDFALPVVSRLEEARLSALEEQAETLLALGEPVEIADLVAEHPLRERLRAVQMTALYRAGRQSEALAAYTALRERLSEELGVDPSPALADLHTRILRQDPALAAPARAATNLPASLTELIGRDAAVAELGGLLRGNRLVTLTGPGGVGKTRLALAVAGQAAGCHPDGVWLVELAPLRPSPASPQVAEAVGEVLGLRDHGSDAMADRLVAALSGKRTLLVLDNCEHVIEDVVRLARRLLQSVSGLSILATSQETLRVTGEVPWPVPPLTPEAAIELFTTRAADISRTPSPTSPGTGAGLDDAAVAEICARLDGIPLALELAAARARVLTPRQLAERLDDRFGLLTSGRRDAPARQRTLRAVIDWSWELLGEQERLVLRRVAVHRDGCTLEAAEVVCAEPGVDVLDVLARLVDRSLVVPSGGRFRLLESVNAYALERLAEAGEDLMARRRHLCHHVALAERAEPLLRGPEQRRALDTLEAESANLRAALDTAVALGESSGGARLAHRLVRSLAWYWVLRGRLGEARRSLEAALTLSDDAETLLWLQSVRLDLGVPVDVDRDRLAEVDPSRRPRLAAVLGRAVFGFEDSSVSVELIEDSLREAGDDRWAVAMALSVRAGHAVLRGDLAALRENGERSLELFRAVGDRWGQGHAAARLSTLPEIGGDYARAAELRRTDLLVAEDLGLWGAVADALARLGRIALLTGDYAAADEYHERSRRLAVEQSNRVTEQFAETGLALSARRQGRLDEAERLLRRCLDWAIGMAGDPGIALLQAQLGFVAEQRAWAAGSRDGSSALAWHQRALAVSLNIGDPRAVALALEGVAGARTLQGRHRDAALLLGQAGALRAAAGAPLPPGEQWDVHRIREHLQAAMSGTDLAAALAEGAGMTPDEALSLTR